MDLDGTLAESIWPREGIGAPIEKTIELCHSLVNDGYKIIVHTSRPWGDYRNIERWLEDQDVPFSEIQCGKPLYRYYVDDKSMFIPWLDQPRAD